MLAIMGIAIAVAGAAVVLDGAWHVAAAQHTIAHARDVRSALRACWIPPGDGAPGQISVRFSFNRDGQVVGQPLITYENPQPSEEGRAAVRDALAQALARCTPLPLSDEFRKVISVHPITVRLGEGWRRGHLRGVYRGRPSLVDACRLCLDDPRLVTGLAGGRFGVSVDGSHPLLTGFGSRIALCRAESHWAPCSCCASSALNAATFCSAWASSAAVPRTCAMSS
jgi:hypothetical protein